MTDLYYHKRHSQEITGAILKYKDGSTENISPEYIVITNDTENFIDVKVGTIDSIERADIVHIEEIIIQAEYTIDIKEIIENYKEIV